MVLYFSGTGNSEYVAKRIAEATQIEALNLFQKIKDNNFKAIHSEKAWVIVAPTYAWRIPRILQNWLESTALTGCKNIYFVLTCGGNIGNSGVYLKKLCIDKGMDYRGCKQIIMPENYIAMFSVPPMEQALSIIDNAQADILSAAQIIKSNMPFKNPDITFKDRLNSGIVNDVFYPLFVKADKFYAKDNCTNCKKCEGLCPLNNITVKNGRPIWGKRCTHCMACICHCPVQAIEYGKKSEGQPRYICPK